MTAERTPDARVEAAARALKAHLHGHPSNGTEADHWRAAALATLAAADAVQRKAPQGQAQVRYADGEWSREYVEDDAAPQAAGVTREAAWDEGMAAGRARWMRDDDNEEYPPVNPYAAADDDAAPEGER